VFRQQYFVVLFIHTSFVFPAKVRKKGKSGE